MDQQKIGKFIALCRKEQGFTQAMLAERLGVTDKAVSKWETGRGLPDVSLYREICAVLDISLNELFAGERIPPEEAEARSEENLLAAAGEEEQKRRKILRGSILAGAGLGMLLTALTLLEKFTRPFTLPKLIWLVLALGAVLYGLRGCSFREERLRTARIISLVLLSVSGLAAMDLGINYLYNLMYEQHDGITACTFMALFLYGDDLWSLEGFFEQFRRTAELAGALAAENVVLACISIMAKR